eukprot:gene10113-2279_t
MQRTTFGRHSNSECCDRTTLTQRVGAGQGAVEMIMQAKVTLKVQCCGDVEKQDALELEFALQRLKYIPPSSTNSRNKT